jgi:hypothetical protein
MSRRRARRTLIAVLGVAAAIGPATNAGAAKPQPSWGVYCDSSSTNVNWVTWKPDSFLIEWLDGAGATVASEEITVSGKLHNQIGRSTPVGATEVHVFMNQRGSVVDAAALLCPPVT